jgi:hypothetical protein
MSILEASETEEDTLLSVGRLKYKYKKFVSENFRQHPFRNADTGWDIRVSNSGMREMEKFRTRDHAVHSTDISLKILDKIVEAAMFEETVADCKKTSGIESVSYLSCPAFLNGTAYTVRLTVKKHKAGEERIYYFHSLRLRA